MEEGEGEGGVGVGGGVGLRWPWVRYPKRVEGWQWGVGEGGVDGERGKGGRGRGGASRQPTMVTKSNMHIAYLQQSYMGTSAVLLILLIPHLSTIQACFNAYCVYLGSFYFHIPKEEEIMFLSNVISRR